MNAAALPLDDALTACAARIEDVLRTCLCERPLADEIERPARLLEAMRYAALGGGKRFRPFLMIECRRLFGAPAEGDWIAAAAVECVHCYSLAHDDLPAMDDDAVRRGRPTLHIAYDEATAILAGDALLTLAFDLLARPGTHPNARIRADLVMALARAAGPGGMGGGQMLDLEAETEAFDERRTLTMQAMKTGALIRASCVMGGLLAEAGPGDRARLAQFGEKLGTVFQIADDLLDLQGDSEVLGKATAKDATRGKATLAALIGPGQATERLSELTADIDEVLEPFGEKADLLRQAARFAASRNH